VLAGTRSTRIAGSSGATCPALEKRLHLRDGTSLDDHPARAALVPGADRKQPTQEGDPPGADDIRESIERAAFYKACVFVPAAPVPTGARCHLSLN